MLDVVDLKSIDGMSAHELILHCDVLWPFGSAGLGSWKMITSLMPLPSLGRGQTLSKAPLLHQASHRPKGFALCLASITLLRSRVFV